MATSRNWVVPAISLVNGMIASQKSRMMFAHISCQSIFFKLAKKW